MRTLIMKFGGTSIDDQQSLGNAVQQVIAQRPRWDRLVVVVAAMEGVTDTLLEAIQCAVQTDQRGYRRIVAGMRTRHLAQVDRMGLNPAEGNIVRADIDAQLYFVLDTLQTMASSPDSSTLQARDAVLGVGEQLAARLLAALLRQSGIRSVAIDSRELIVTDAAFGFASADLTLTRQHVEDILLPLMESDIVPVVTGFTAATPDGKTTTMGRGGSSYTAAIMSLTMAAPELWIWTKPGGVLTADPHLVPEPIVIPFLSYEQAELMTTLGVSILQRRMIRLLAATGTPILLRDIRSPDRVGTRIGPPNESLAPRLIGVARLPVLLITLEADPGLAEVLPLLHRQMRRTTGQDGSLVYLHRDAGRLTLVYAPPLRSDVARIRQGVTQELAGLGDKSQICEASAVSVVGDLRHQPGLPAALAQAMALIDGHGTFTDRDWRYWTVVVDETQLEAAVRSLHELVVRYQHPTAIP
jgi:aspartate kinase